MQEQLSNLKEIPLPEPVSYFPQTAAWYILLALAVIILAFWLAHLYRVSLRNRYRREALKTLDEIERSVRPVSELPVLVKRIGLAIAPRKTVASLSGDAWLRFLDSAWQGTAFTKGPGKILPELAYKSPQSLPPVSDERLQDLFALLRQWIRRHRARI